ncbi:MAG: tyrosine-type recombinase/integrase [Pseudobdellovibrionaceae bacterium]
MTDKLTKRFIDSLEYNAEAKARDVRWDSDISGFGIRIYPSGKKSFVLSYRQNGTKRLFTIGQYGNITLEQARVLAQKKMGEVADGKDPLLTRRAAKKKHDWNVNKAGKEFLKKLKSTSDRHHGEVERIFEKDIFPTIGKMPIDEVKKDHILKIIDNVLERGSGIMANRTLMRLSRFFNWCIERNLIEFSPVYKLPKPTQERTRDRVVADFEIKEILQVAATTNYPFGPLVLFLLLTGQRRGEAASMAWTDYDREQRLWILPREHTKSDRAHAVPLSDRAINILENAPKLGDYIFTSAGNKPFENFSRAKKILDTRIKTLRSKDRQVNMTSWTLHDLRRTCASGMARLGVAPHVIEKALNHSSGKIRGVAAIYNRYEYATEMREAFDSWAEYVEKIMVTDVPKSVLKVPIARKRGMH